MAYDTIEAFQPLILVFVIIVISAVFCYYFLEFEWELVFLVACLFISFLYFWGIFDSIYFAGSLIGFGVMLFIKIKERSGVIFLNR